MSTFAYEYYKRNKAVLQIGKKKEDEKILKEVKVQDGKHFYTSVTEPTSNTIYCYYESLPKFNLESGFNSNSSALIEAVNEIGNAWNAGKAVYNALGGYSGIKQKIKDAATTESFQGAAKELLDGLKQANDTTYAIGAVPGVMRWGGQDPISFSVKLIFLDKEGGPVYFDEKIQMLTSLVTFSKTGMDGFTMKGPIGFNGTVTKISNMEHFLKGEEDSLHSLTLYKGDKIDGSIAKVLDLHKILVVSSVDLEMSEQLYVKPKNAPKLRDISSSDRTWGENFPAYKWITANVKFSTVCPLPSSLSEYKTNVSNLYGLSNHP